jgi:L-asparaginase II
VIVNPDLVAGKGRFDTEFMTLFGAKVFTKTGAEGVFIAALPAVGIGIAVKADDGAGRAAEVMIASLVARCARFTEAERGAAQRFLEPELKNWRGISVGRLKAAGPLAPS